MSSTTIDSTTRNYSLLHQEINALIEGEKNMFANIGNILAAIKFRMNWFWVGLYKVENDELVLFMFQGPHACTRIKREKGCSELAGKKTKQ
ncbi:MAG: GAF domain-containing protein [Parvicellaceae bacterium]